MIPGNSSANNIICLRTGAYKRSEKINFLVAKFNFNLWFNIIFTVFVKILDGKFLYKNSIILLDFILLELYILIYIDK